VGQWDPIQTFQFYTIRNWKFGDPYRSATPKNSDVKMLEAYEMWTCSGKWKAHTTGG